MSLSRKCVPFTPFDGELSKATVAIVTAGGVHLKEQEPFNTADELGDLTFRVIPDDADTSQLMATTTTTTRTPTKTSTSSSRSTCCAT
jgi:D-proline reductase (dithiol) PrdB